MVESHVSFCEVLRYVADEGLLGSSLMLFSLVSGVDVVYSSVPAVRWAFMVDGSTRDGDDRRIDDFLSFTWEQRDDGTIWLQKVAINAKPRDDLITKLYISIPDMNRILWRLR